MKNITLHDKSIGKNQNGFTLIEVLVSMVVLSIGLLSIAAMQTSALKGNAQSNNLTERATIASNHIEHFLNIPFNDPDLIDLSTDGIDNDGNSIVDDPNEMHTPESDGIDNDGDGAIDEPDDDGEADYTITWNITDNNADRKIIALTITGIQYGTTKSVTINTVKVR